MQAKLAEREGGRGGGGRGGGGGGKVEEGEVEEGGERRFDKKVFWEKFETKILDVKTKKTANVRRRFTQLNISPFPRILQGLDLPLGNPY